MVVFLGLLYRRSIIVQYTPVYKKPFFPPIFVSKSCVLYMLVEFFKN